MPLKFRFLSMIHFTRSDLTKAKKDKEVKFYCNLIFHILVFGEKVTHTCFHIHMQKKNWSVKSRTSKLCSCLAAGRDSEGIATMPQASMFWCCASACLCQMGTSWDLGILGSWDLGINAKLSSSGFILCTCQDVKCQIVSVVGCSGFGLYL